MAVSKIKPVETGTIVSAVEQWLDDNISGGQTLAVDTSLSVTGAAAESKTVGNKIAELTAANSDLKSALTNYEEINKPYLFNPLAFSIGGIDVSNGEYVINSNKARASVLNIDFDAPFTVVTKNGWAVFVYMSKDGALTNKGQWFENTEVAITDTSYTYSFAVKHGNDSDLTSALATIGENVYFKYTASNIKKIYESVSDHEARLSTAESSIVKLENDVSVDEIINKEYLKNRMGFTLGAIDLVNGEYKIFPAQKHRISVLNLTFDKPVDILVGSGWGIYVYTMTTGGTAGNWAAWFENEIHITDTTLTYSFALKYGSESDLTDYVKAAQEEVLFVYPDTFVGNVGDDVSALNSKTEKYEIVNLANLLVESGVMAYNGVYLQNVSYHVSWKVKGGEKYLVSGVHISNTYPLYVILSGGVAKAYYTYGENNAVLSNIYVEIPSGCDQIVVNGWSQNIGIKYYRPLDIVFEQNMWKYLVVEAQEGFMLPSGNINTSLGSSAHYKTFPVSANDQVRISGRRYSNLAGPAWLLLKDGVVVDYQNANNMPDSAWSAVDNQYYEDFQMTIPNGVDSIIVNCGRAKGGRCAVRSPRDMEPSVKKLNGKTAVVYGTSIFSNTMSFDGNVFSIPSYAGMLLGMDVINEAVGASIAARGNASVETADDSYGWTGVSWYAVFRAMGKNLTECQDLIDNYGSKWYDKIAGPDDPLYTDAKPQPPLSQQYIDEIKADSYENKLIPYLDGTKPMPDLFIFEHGHNDFWNDGDYGNLPEDESNMNMSSYMGAMSFYIKKIFEANRNAKILIVSFYDGSESTTKHGAEIVAGQKALADYQNVYFCDLSVTGWNQRLVTTTGYWGELDAEQNGYYWIPSGGAERTITRRQYYIPDDLHPHLDASGRAVKQAGEILADYIKNHITLD